MAIRKKFGIPEALVKLSPESIWVCRGDNYSDIEWKDLDNPMPTEEDVMAEIERLQSEYDAQNYARDRSENYPPLSDFADAMYWASKGDTSYLEAYYAACESVKLQFPKP